ncbi:zinc-ribbon domain-containing protein [Alteromonadaceae bacterium BrNp21-10]|nr:zinc-ribbon domain-containing protein [Alteromonadaceae bacterium BrNp21-10]
MALTNCPSCNKKISDKAKECSHCGFAIGSATEDDVRRKKVLNRVHKSQQLMTQSMIAMLMFIGGMGMMFWGDVDKGSTQYKWAMFAAFVGFVWYIVNRIRGIWLKKSGL